MVRRRGLEKKFKKPTAKKKMLLSPRLKRREEDDLLGLEVVIKEFGDAWDIL